MRCELAILYRPELGNAVALAAVNDRRLLAATAEKAIEESELAAKALADSDAVLGEMQRLEAKRLRELLHTVLPELQLPQPASNRLM